MNKHKRSYLDMQQEEATWESGRYALRNGASPQQQERDGSLFNTFKGIAISLGLDTGLLPGSNAQFALTEDRLER